MLGICSVCGELIHVCLAGRSAAEFRRHGASSGGGGKVLFPDQQQQQQGESESEGRHSSRRWQHGLLVSSAEPLIPAIPRSVCQLYPDAGPCSGHVTAWYWDSAEDHCKTFHYGGCRGNGNNFITHDECRAVCDIGRRTPV